MLQGALANNSGPVLSPSLGDDTILQCFSSCGLRTNSGPLQFVKWSADGFRRKSIAEIVSDTEQMKNTPIHVCAKTVFVTLTTGIIFLLFTSVHF
jgi:hypothetical protein